MFSSRTLFALIFPLFLEQLLSMSVGIADTFFVSFIGLESVSGVSLINSFNTIFIYLFTALASGGAVVISQYIGSGKDDMASLSSSQLFTSSLVFSLVLSSLVFAFDKELLLLLFGQVDDSVMEVCITYLEISILSYPFLAVYNAGAALLRSKGKSSTILYVSILANLINTVGNALGVFVFKAGVAGVAWPSLISRAFSAVAVSYVCFKKDEKIRYSLNSILTWRSDVQKLMLSIAVPNGFESGVFQLVKVALSSVVALFGTYQIAANGIAQSIWSLASLVSVALGPAFITVIGQCMGKGDTLLADFYFRKLMKITLTFSSIWNMLVFLITVPLLSLFAVEAEVRELVISLVLVHNIFSAFAFPFADPLGKGLRAAGDVRFTTITSIFTTTIVRLGFSFFFALYLDLGVMGIAYAMCMDWLIRGVILFYRYRSGRWKAFRVIDNL